MKEIQLQKSSQNPSNRNQSLVQQTNLQPVNLTNPKNYSFSQFQNSLTDNFFHLTNSSLNLNE